MDEAPVFSRGDLVVHPRRPEWGQGVVEQAASIEYEGRQAQRLVVTFRSRGRVSINTGVVALMGADGRTMPPGADAGNAGGASGSASGGISDRISDKDANGTMSSSITRDHAARGGSRHEGQGWLGQMAQRRENAPVGGPLQELPDAMLDPFAGSLTRLEATVDSFRFGDDPTRNPRGLIEWAMAQTGRQDPLSDHTRHELEEAFVWFGRKRDRHLFELVQELKRNGQRGEVEKLARQTRHPSARVKLEKALRA
jgi:hypothetical protein